MRHLRGIDGLKGLSILAILGYHLFGHWVPGGFIGIEVFFVISGFLAARGLLLRLNSTGSLHLGIYYLKRLRRVVPAAWFMAAFIVALAWAVQAGDALVGIRNQLLSVGTFTYNWRDIVAGVDYFAATGPELFKHLWFISLLVQFYAVVPLIVWFFWKFWKPQRAAAGILILTFASALAMGLLFVPGTDPTRVYFGTDTHCFGLLVGVALAFMVDGYTGSEGARGKDSEDFSMHRLRYTLAPLLGSAALVGIVYLMVSVVRQDSSAFRGGLLLVALLTAMTIVGSITPWSWLGTVLELKPLVVLGKYSYGIYLWHWPLWTLVLFLVPQWRSETIPYASLVALVLTALMTWVSYICIERPIGRQGVLRTVVPPADKTRSEWIVWFVSILLVLFSVTGCALGIHSAPEATETQLLLQKNQMWHDGRQKKQPRPARLATDAIKEAPPQPVRQMPTGQRMIAVGDSVMLAAQPALEKQFSGISVDAAVSRSMSAGIDIVRHLQAERQLREYVVVSLGTNSMVTTAQLDQLTHSVGPGRVVVLVNAHGQRSWIPPTNTVLREYAQAHSDDVVLADWDAAASAHESDLYSDGIHPRPGEGEQLYVSTVKDAIARWAKNH
ncbi:MAG: acetyltransferase [Bifidobacteriaceae bacterium]|nr:acetyltransferase [Bifidobacteriaceae bacterium]MCI1978571.1 acetyltransferase [Bifidobacteriaceae bacterium]